MALFSFCDLQPAPATPELRDALKVSGHEALLARRLQGTRRWDAGRRVVEIIVPSRLPEEVNLQAEGLLRQNLGLAAPDFTYGAYRHPALSKHYGVSELVILHLWGADEEAFSLETHAEDDELDWNLVWPSFAVVAFFDPPVWGRLHWLPWRLWLRLRSCRATEPLRRWREDDFR